MKKFLFGNEYLTKKEVQVLKFVLLGMSMKQIACILAINPRTVETHINNLKLSCRQKHP